MGEYDWFDGKMTYEGKTLWSCILYFNDGGLYLMMMFNWIIISGYIKKMIIIKKYLEYMNFEIMLKVWWCMVEYESFGFFTMIW